ncbi:MAG: S8 family peptidase [bacterium]
MRKLCVIALLSSLILLSANISARSESPGKLSPGLVALGQLNDTSVTVLAFMEDGSEQLKLAKSQTLQTPRLAVQHQMLIRDLQNKSQSRRFAASFPELIESGDLVVEREYWIADVVKLRVKARALAVLSVSPEIHYLVEDAPLQLVAPVSSAAAAQTNSGSWSGIDLIGARQLWNQGYTGRGRLVCSFDTGVESDHPALAGRWRGNLGDTGAAWFDPFGTELPIDLAGHGTHTMGLMVGRDGADTIGVAFNAEWMSAAVVDRGQSLSKTISDIIAAFEWAADPDGDPSTVSDLPDVLCNSWGIPAGLMNPCDETFWQAIDNLEALGVVAIFACGNEGPDQGTIRNPADRASGPGNAFSVGAVDQTLLNLPVASFSSRGPGNCDDGDIKPELVAPGVGIRSAYKDGTYRVISGTSMAAPLVAGAVALLREYNPDATVEQIKSALLASARDLGPVGQDNDYGWGLIDVAAAMELLPVPSKPKLLLTDVTIGAGGSSVLTHGVTSSLDVVLTNSNLSIDDLWARLRCKSNQVVVLKDSVYLGRADDGEQVAAGADPFLVKLDHQLASGTPLLFQLDAYSTELGFLNSLEFTLVSDQPITGAVLHAETDRLEVDLTNFGRAENLKAAVLGSEVLSSLSLMVVDQTGEVIDAVPGELDWLAASGFDVGQDGDGWESVCKFTDATGAFEVTQTAQLGVSLGQQSYLVLEYESSNSGAGPLQIGVALDVDLVGGEVLVAEAGDWLGRSSGGQSQLGVRVLSGGAMATAVDGELYKSGVATDVEKAEWLTANPTNFSNSVGDQVLLLRFPSQTTLNEPLRIAAAIAVGNSDIGIIQSLDRAEERYLTATAIDDTEELILPETFTLQQNYPNPFNAETVVEFSLPSAGAYRFEIFDLLGRLVYVTDAAAVAGPQRIVWQSTARDGQVVASGVYFYRLSFAGNSLTRKMVLLK